MSSLCKSSVNRVYQEVIDDVINSVRDVFKDDGVDEVILQELKSTWEAKLAASKAIFNEQEEKLKQKQNEVSTVNGFPRQLIAQPMQHPNLANQHQVTQVVDNKVVPIQITLPPQPGSDSQRILNIQVPNSALHGNHLQKILSGPIMAATMSLPPNIAASLLQQHVNAAFGSQPQTVALVKQNIVQTDGQVNVDETKDENNTVWVQLIAPCVKECSKSHKNIKKFCKSTKRKVDQIDGPLDTSDEEEEPSDDNDEEDDDFDEEKDEDNDMEDEVGEEEPLNSEDDVSDEDPGDLFDTENIVVCQYDKIIRNRNKWKFHLKDGIMNLSGQDYVFQKANGDAEW